MDARPLLCRSALLFACVSLSWPAAGPTAAAFQEKPAPEKPAVSKAAPKKPAFRQEEIEQLVAPIALHPDALVSQILMASTYPLQVVEAARWVKANPNVKGAELTTALEALDWDPSVKSLVNFPQVLEMMDQQLDWTQQLGDAVLSQQKEVMAAVQKLRGKAQESGNLKTTEEQKVTVEGSTQTIVIESTDPEVVYVPVYNPTVVYGTWPYAAYPPYYYYPPGYAATASAFSFMAGAAVGASWGYAWGHCDWDHGDIDIDCDRNVNFNQNIDRGKYKNQFSAENRGGLADGKGSWQHDPASRKGVGYRDQATASRYHGATAADTRAREQFRGRAESGQRDLASGGAGGERAAGASARGAGTSARSTGAAGAGTRASSSSARTSSRSQSAFDGYGQKSQVKQQASRGQASRRQSVSPQVRSGASRPSGGARGGGRGGRR